MAPGRRVERVAALIRRETSELLIHGIRDERVHQGMVSITEVEVSGDLQHCKIFVSIYGEDADKQNVLEGLKAASGYLRGELGRRLQMRRAPEVVFQLDRGIEKGTTVLHLLNRLEEERQERDDQPQSSEQESGEPL
ncbi:ribosome-binding factor A [Synechococcus sp. RS9909]|uniref:30S ribosome-binding factor RbfA n=1 Tax=unclassified Synechococcus TaxID=2626047 RepID=UPI000068F9D3|nr:MULTISPECIES: 30S ribosome-binding factor RbfA [unclassified Synechococcus]EAQ68242.1 Ribosome-binding factor A [Synechococcus sp. RS9917]QNI80498.1 ribosome-binding factor A [Synechococcus sp. RS9909]